ncbi:hypothetical protein AAW14_36245, partial [Streptomyces hygroscopicus]|nr:hypothetical protein [Streptomyces hygroscopicus]
MVAGTAGIAQVAAQVDRLARVVDGRGGRAHQGRFLQRGRRVRDVRSRGRVEVGAARFLRGVARVLYDVALVIEDVALRVQVPRRGDLPRGQLGRPLGQHRRVVREPVVAVRELHRVLRDHRPLRQVHRAVRELHRALGQRDCVLREFGDVDAGDALQPLRDVADLRQTRT